MTRYPIGYLLQIPADRCVMCSGLRGRQRTVVAFVQARDETAIVVDFSRRDEHVVVFDWAFDGGAWPGPLSDGRAAVLGEAWLGPLGLLARLELELGIGGGHASSIERTASLAKALAVTEGDWSGSVEVDPLAAAARVERDRDLLALAGWAGEPAGARLDALWVVTSAFPGLPDRIRRVIAVLERHRTSISRIHAFESPHALTPLWRTLLAALERSGVVLECAPHSVTKSAGDLDLARNRRQTTQRPHGDGSLQLVRPHGILAAAEETAAALAALPDLDGVVVIGADEVLDAALARHGLPRTGASGSISSTPALVRLCAELAFEPSDAADVHALLCIRPNPIPWNIARRLSRALRRFPARRSPHWRAELDGGFDEIEPARRDAVAARVAILEPIAQRGDRLRSDLLVARWNLLAAWARGRSPEPGCSDLVAFVERAIALVHRLGNDSVGLAEVRRVCDEVEAPALRGAAELGLAAVAEPGGVVGPAERIVWWNFTRASAPSELRLRLSCLERAALAAYGVIVPEPGATLASSARRWHRPLELARDALILVCPRVDEAGEAAHPHPLWNELAAGWRDVASTARVTLPRALPAAFDLVTVATPIEPSDVESASSIEQLLGCSLAYALERLGRLRTGLAARVADPNKPRTCSPSRFANAMSRSRSSCVGTRLTTIARTPSKSTRREPGLRAATTDRLAWRRVLDAHTVRVGGPSHIELLHARADGPVSAPLSAFHLSWLRASVRAGAHLFIQRGRV